MMQRLYNTYDNTAKSVLNITDICTHILTRLNLLDYQSLIDLPLCKSNAPTNPKYLDDFVEDNYFLGSRDMAVKNLLRNVNKDNNDTSIRYTYDHIKVNGIKIRAIDAGVYDKDNKLSGDDADDLNELRAAIDFMQLNKIGKIHKVDFIEYGSTLEYINRTEVKYAKRISKLSLMHLLYLIYRYNLIFNGVEVIKSNILVNNRYAYLELIFDLFNNSDKIPLEIKDIFYSKISKIYHSESPIAVDVSGRNISCRTHYKELSNIEEYFILNDDKLNRLINYSHIIDKLKSEGIDDDELYNKARISYNLKYQSNKYNKDWMQSLLLDNRDITELIYSTDQVLSSVIDILSDHRSMEYYIRNYCPELNNYNFKNNTFPTIMNKKLLLEYSNIYDKSEIIEVIDKINKS